jgi:hypothetical protein
VYLRIRRNLAYPVGQAPASVARRAQASNQVDYEASLPAVARWLVFGVHMSDLHGELRNEHMIPVVRAPKLESSWDWELPSLSR